MIPIYDNFPPNKTSERDKHFQEEIKATDRIGKLYYLGAQHNIWYCLDKIKKEFNIKD